MPTKWAGCNELLTLGWLAPTALEAQLTEDLDNESFSEGRAADPVFFTGRLESFATRTANQVFQLKARVFCQTCR